MKGKSNETKKTVQFKLGDAMFSRRDAKGSLCQMPTNELDEEIFSADGATLKPDNKKIYGKDCVFTSNKIKMKISSQ